MCWKLGFCVFRADILLREEGAGKERWLDGAEHPRGKGELVVRVFSSKSTDLLASFAIEQDRVSSAEFGLGFLGWKIG